MAMGNPPLDENVPLKPLLLGDTPQFAKQIHHFTDQLYPFTILEA
jgi:hypothetical protein